MIIIKPYGLVFTDLITTVSAARPYGIYDIASTIPWRFTSQNFGCRIENADVFSNGLVISTTIPDDLKTVSPDGIVTIDITVNNVKIGTYQPESSGLIRISPDELDEAANLEGICQIDCFVNSSFIPNELHPENPDMRSLAIILYSITAADERIDK